MPGSAGAMQSPHEISNPETVSSSLLDLLWQFGWGRCQWAVAMSWLNASVGVSEKHLHASAWGEVLVAGHFWALVPCQCSHRTFG